MSNRLSLPIMKNHNASNNSNASDGSQNSLGHRKAYATLQISSSAPASLDDSNILPLFRKSVSSDSATLSSGQSSPERKNTRLGSKFSLSKPKDSDPLLSHSSSKNSSVHYDNKSIPTCRLVITITFSILVLFIYIISRYYFEYHHFNFNANDYDTKTVTFTSDPLIYPDLSSLVSSSSSFPFSKFSKDTPKKAPGDHAAMRNDPEMVPAAAKGSLYKNKNRKMNNNNQNNEKDKNDGDNTNKENKNQNLANTVFRPESSFFAHSKSKASINSNNNRASSSPQLVLVLTLNPERYQQEYLDKILQNRIKYAKKFGYGLYARLVSDFKAIYRDSFSESPSWAKIPAVRAAGRAFPNSQQFWYLDSSALINDFDTPIGEKLLESGVLGSHLRRKARVAKDYGSAKAYTDTPVKDMQLVIGQNEKGVNPVSFVLMKNKTINKNKSKDEENNYFNALLDLWCDKAYRKYRGFADGSEEDALNHLLTWHPTFLSKTAVVEPRALASLLEKKDDEEKEKNQGEAKEEYLYSKGDTALVLDKCLDTSTFECMKQLSQYEK